jgi:hypothetical protein
MMASISFQRETIRWPVLRVEADGGSRRHRLPVACCAAAGPAAKGGKLPCAGAASRTAVGAMRPFNSGGYKVQRRNMARREPQAAFRHRLNARWQVGSSVQDVPHADSLAPVGDARTHRRWMPHCVGVICVR